MSCHEAAQEYVRRGWCVVPLWGIVTQANGRVICRCPRGPNCPPKSMGKHPRFPNWPERALRSGPDVFEHFERYPDDNIGILTGLESGIFGVDLDGLTGMESWRQLCLAHNVQPPPPNVITGGQGAHIWFRLPEGVVVHNSAGLLGEGIDVRGENGQLVAPPSVSGRGPYHLFDNRLHEPTPWLLELLAAQAESIAAKAVEPVRAEQIDLTALPASVRDLASEIPAPGTRSEHFYALVAACQDAGLTQGQAVAVAAPWCAASGKFEGRVEAEVARAWGKVQADREALENWVPDQIDETTAIEFWSARPILTHIHDFAHARRVSPWAVLGVTLARVIVMTPFTVKLPPIVGGEASLNLFVGLVGISGSGKGAAEAVAAEAVPIALMPETQTVGSGEGIAHAYKINKKGVPEWRNDHHSALFSVPEIDSLAAQASRRGSTTMPELRRAWSGETLGFAYADPTRRVPIERHQYRLCLIAGIQPGRGGALLSEDEVAGGTPQRFLWLPAVDPDIPDVRPPCPQAWQWTPPRTDGVQRMTVCEVACQMIDAAALARARGQAGALDGHLLLTQLKTAAALAIIEGRWNVNDDDWHLAGVIVEQSTRVREGIIEELRKKQREVNKARAEAEATRAVIVERAREDNTIQRACRNLTKRLKNGQEWTEGRLKNTLRKGEARAAFDDALDLLHAAAQVVIEGEAPKRRIRAAEAENNG